MNVLLITTDRQRADPAYAATSADVVAPLAEVMNHDVRTEPTVRLVA